MAEQKKYMQFEFLFGLAKQASDIGNALREKYLAATSGKDEAIQSVLNTSDDEKIVEWRAYNAKGLASIEATQKKLAEAREAILAKAEELAAVSQDTNPEEIKAEFIDTRKKYSDAIDTITSWIGDDKEEIQAGLDHFKIAPIPGLGRGTKATGATGIARPRISRAVVDGKPVEDKNGKVTFTMVSGHLGIDNNEFQQAAFKAAGVESWSDLDPETEVSFNLTVKDKEHAIVLTTNPSKAKANTDADEAEDTDEK